MRWRLLCLFVFSTSRVCAAQIPARIPVETFAALPAIQSAVISPDGAHVAYLTNANNAIIVNVVEVASRKTKAVMAGTDRFWIRWCNWKNDKRLLCGLRGTEFEVGQPYPISRLVAVDADGANMKVLIQNSARGGSSQFQDHIVNWLPNEAEDVLIEASDDAADFDPFPSVYRLNVNNGRMQTVNRQRAPVTDWLTDTKGEVRLGVGRKDNVRSYITRLQGQHEWQTLLKYERFKQEGFAPLGFDSDGRTLYVSSSYKDRDSMFAIDLLKENESRMVFHNDEVDMDAAVFDDFDGHLVAVRYETDKPQIHYFDTKEWLTQQLIDESLHGSINDIGSRSRDGRLRIVRSTRDVAAPTYYLFDTKASSFALIGNAYPDLKPEMMAPMRPITIKARDGASLPGYLTLPLGREAKHMPLIVYPHGGPESRDSWGFDFMVQFLANRGYAVLQVNFRGSSGYGGEWESAGYQAWGSVMHDDITDAAHWAINEGIADPARMCIVGWSYGGYAALLGVAKEPDLYRCGASIAGVSDLLGLEREWARFYTGRTDAEARIGKDSKELRATSPRRLAESIKAPLLLVHGTWDINVQVAQSRQMVSALKSANKQYDYLEIEHADHSLTEPAARVTMLKKLEAFLDQHLHGGS